MSGALHLPEGREGKALAVGVTVLGLILVWLALVSPLIGWYGARAAALAQQQAIAAHMQTLIRETPLLRQAVMAARPQAQDRQILLPGDSDAIAGANLQSLLQNLAAQAGTSLQSAEVMPGRPQGALRRIDIQLSVTAAWPVLISYLQAISTARPRMIVSALSIINNSGDPASDSLAQADFTVSAFSASAP